MTKEEFFRLLNWLYVFTPLSLTHLQELLNHREETELSTEVRAWIEEWCRA